MTVATIIPVVATGAPRLRPPPDPLPLPELSPGEGLADRLGRSLRDLRISVIDQCNQRCPYCMPREVFHKDYRYLDRQDLLSFDEIERLVRAFLPLGVRKLRLTGGEPLLRKGIEDLVAQLSGLKTPDGSGLDLALTTNGLLLGQKAQRLADAGLNRVTVSLDALTPALFQRMADTPEAHPQMVLDGIATALKAGLKVKANMVVQKGVNDGEVLPMAKAFRDLGCTLRFIEYMDVGSTNHWQLEHVLPSAEIVARISQEHPLTRVGRDTPSEVSERWAYDDGQGQIGMISSVTQPFCGDCSRARISAEGGLYTCLFASQGVDLRSLLRSSTGTDPITGVLARVWQERGDRYSELRSRRMQPEGDAEAVNLPRVEMSYIGG